MVMDQGEKMLGLLRVQYSAVTYLVSKRKMLEAGTKIFKVCHTPMGLANQLAGDYGISGEENDISQLIAGQPNPPDSFLIFAKCHEALVDEKETEAPHRGQSEGKGQSWWRQRQAESTYV